MIPTLVAYVPVVHRGYLELFERYPHTLYVLDTSILELVPYLSRDVRACDPYIVVEMVRALNIFWDVKLANADALTNLAQANQAMVLPDEDISRAVADRFFTNGQSVEFAQVFLRWHQKNAASETNPAADRTVTTEEFHREMLRCVDQESRRSSDWWRQVGACVVRDGRILLLAHNTHFPTEHTPYIVGDPRTPFSWGERIDVSSAGHAERLLIGEAARRGISLDGADLYVTTFPCPGCAIQIAVARCKRVFYRDGYSLAAADEILRLRGVEIIRVL